MDLAIRLIALARQPHCPLAFVEPEQEGVLARPGPVEEESQEAVVLH
jgi:hypothetical protein